VVGDIWLLSTKIACKGFLLNRLRREPEELLLEDE
jgi:hypothetical protein